MKSNNFTLIMEAFANVETSALIKIANNDITFFGRYKALVSKLKKLRRTDAFIVSYLEEKMLEEVEEANKNA